jgi:hypothetical protein
VVNKASSVSCSQKVNYASANQYLDVGKIGLDGVEW